VTQTQNSLAAANSLVIKKFAHVLLALSLDQLDKA
jgi:hypothetical protein